MENISIPVNKILAKFKKCEKTYLTWWVREPQEVVTILSILYPSRDFDFCYGVSWLSNIDVGKVSVDYIRIDALDLYFIAYKILNKN
jgi:hypothetical protein